MINGLFRKHNNLLAAISEIIDGPMGISTAINETNRQRFFDKLGISDTQVARAHLTHGSTIVPVTEPGSYNGDGLVTKNNNLFLIVTVADCLPILLYDPDHNALGLLHAGWRGLAAGIAEGSVGAMKESFSTLPEQLVVVVGPGIGACHYDINNEVAEQFDKSVLEKRDDKIFLDLGAEAVGQLKKAGAIEKNITVMPECTYEKTDKYFSWRRDKPGELRTMVAVIGKR
ncbi:peptidoglycan editing factor PgeF [Patescibacteria group bacterium]